MEKTKKQVDVEFTVHLKIELNSSQSIEEVRCFYQDYILSDLKRKINFDLLTKNDSVDINIKHINIKDDKRTDVNIDDNQIKIKLPDVLTDTLYCTVLVDDIVLGDVVLHGYNVCKIELYDHALCALGYKKLVLENCILDYLRQRGYLPVWLEKSKTEEQEWYLPKEPPMTLLSAELDKTESQEYCSQKDGDYK